MKLCLVLTDMRVYPKESIDIVIKGVAIEGCLGSRNQNVVAKVFPNTPNQKKRIEPVLSFFNYNVYIHDVELLGMPNYLSKHIYRIQYLKNSKLIDSIEDISQSETHQPVPSNISTYAQSIMNKKCKCDKGIKPKVGRSPRFMLRVMGIMLPMILIIGIFFLIWIWGMPGSAELHVGFALIVAFLIVGLIVWLYYWNLWFRDYQIGTAGIKQTGFLCKHEEVLWTEFVECRICKVRMGWASWSYFISFSRIPMQQPQPCKVSIGMAVRSKDALFLPLCLEALDDVKKHAPSGLAKALRDDPMYPIENTGVGDSPKR